MSKEMLELADEMQRCRWRDIEPVISPDLYDRIVAALRASTVAEPVADAEFSYRFEYADGSAFEVMPDDRLFLTWPDGRREEKLGKITSRLTRFYGVRPAHLAPAAPVPASVREALEPFAEAWFAYGDKPSDDTPLSDNAGAAYLEGRKITFGDLRRAAAALASLPAPEAAPTREEIARIIYDAFPFEPSGNVPNKPAWVAAGNAMRQDEARRAADAIIALKSAPAK